jgi:plasmid stabilization system protein ParE
VSLPLYLRPEAEADILVGRDWYDRGRPGLGDEFVESLENLLSRIQESPALFAVGYRGIRRARIQRFPYITYYQLLDDRIEVIAVLHASRNPRIWQRRAQQ